MNGHASSAPGPASGRHDGTTVADAGRDRELGTIVQTMGDGFVVMDPAGRIVEWNRAAERLFGWARADVLGRTVADVLVPPEWRAAHTAAVARFATTGRRTFADPAAMTALCRDGSRRTVELTLTAAPGAGPVRTYGFLRDVTARRRAEEQAQAARDEADRANAAKSEFMSRLSHELRTPLHAVLGFAQLLALEDPSTAQQESIEHILTSGRHLLDLVDEVLDIARAESGELHLTSEQVPVVDLVAETVDLLRPVAARQGVRLSVPPPTGPEPTAQADRQRLRQVLLNLLSNAIKYNRPDGSVTLTCHATDDRQVRIDVTDTGPGIRDEHRDRLFAPFDRLEAAPTTEGTGLGLSLSRHLVEAMAGHLDLTSTPGRGSTFTVHLPAPAPRTADSRR